MPNYVFNKIEIIGTDDQIFEVREFIKGRPFTDDKEYCIDFNKIIPSPEDRSIEWCEDNWGTKWNALDQCVKADDVITFRTAWNYVPRIVERLSQLFPAVTFKYDASNMNEHVFEIYLNGEIIEESSEALLYGSKLEDLPDEEPDFDENDQSL
jgi:hypothetical protein